MRVLFVYYSNTETVFMPVSLAVLGGALRDAGFECKVFDTSFWNDVNYPTLETDREVRERLGVFKKVDGYAPSCVPVDVNQRFREVVQEFQPGLIAVTSTSHEFHTIMKFTSPVRREYGVPVLVGGAHATVVPERAISSDGLDMICVGEGVDAIVEVARALSEGRSPSRIPGIWYKHPDGKIIKNGLGTQSKPMDELPEPDWDIIDPRHRVRPFEGELKDYGFFESSRGCPFNCSYCINSELHKLRPAQAHRSQHSLNVTREKPAGSYRYHTPGELVRRLKKYRQKYGFNHIHFIDENMPTMPLKNLTELAELYKAEVDIPFFTQSRPEYFVKTPEKAKVLAQMGCRMIGMGAESGNDHLRRTVLNRPMKDGTLESASEILKANGIMVAAYYVIGFPGETREMIEETIAMHVRIAPHRHSIRFLHPYPGTPIRKVCVDNGWFPDDYESQVVPKSFFIDPVMDLPSPPHPTKQELMELREKFSEAYRWTG
jgi:anaerobic magnesium-protoporphyrin IX monomethyl ester cyclase